MQEALRVLGLPARFVSGYLDCAASEAGRASTHAWAEAYLPEVGWTGYDPTLGESGGFFVYDFWITSDRVLAWAYWPERAS